MIKEIFYTKKASGRGIGLYLAKKCLNSVDLDIYATNDKEYNIYLSELQKLGYAEEISNPLCDNGGYFDSSKIYINIQKREITTKLKRLSYVVMNY